MGVSRFGDVLGVCEGGSGSGDVGGSAGDGVGDADDVQGAGADRGDGLAVPGADVGASACDGAVSGPVESPSYPSYGSWCSCFHWTWQQDGESTQPSTSEREQNRRRHEVTQIYDRDFESKCSIL